MSLDKELERYVGRMLECQRQVDFGGKNWEDASDRLVELKTNLAAQIKATILEAYMQKKPEVLHKDDLAKAIKLGVAPDSYNQALSDCEKAIKDMLR